VCAYRLEVQAQELDRKRQRLQEQYQQTKRGSGSSSLEGSGHFSSMKKASIDSTVGSPVQHPRSSPLLPPHRLTEVEEDKSDLDLPARHDCGGEDWW